jgi:predicted transposase YbfD/YdcC
LDKYVEFVCDQAKNLNMFFLLDTGEGRSAYDIELDIDIEDLSGWLLPSELKTDAISVRKQHGSMKDFKEYYCLATWYYDSESNLQITFEFLKDYS